MADNHDFSEYVGLKWHNGYVQKLRQENAGIQSVSVEDADTEFDLNPRSDRIRVAIDQNDVVRSVNIG